VRSNGAVTRLEDVYLVRDDADQSGNNLFYLAGSAEGAQFFPNVADASAAGFASLSDATRAAGF